MLQNSPDDYAQYADWISLTFYNKFDIDNYLRILPYDEEDLSLRVNLENPLGMPGNELSAPSYEQDDYQKIQRELVEHCVYREFSTRNSKRLNDEIDEYLSDFGVRKSADKDADDEEYRLYYLRMVGLVSSVATWYFYDLGLPMKSERTKISLFRNQEYEAHVGGKTINTSRINKAVKKAKELQALLSPDLLMGTWNGISRLETQLNTFIHLNERVLNKEDRLQHYLYHSAKNDPKFSEKMMVSRLTGFFYYTSGEFKSDLVECIATWIVSTYDQATLRRHMDEAEEFITEYDTYLP